MDTLTPDALDSPAVGILSQLEADGFRVRLEPDTRLVIAPRSQLTPERMAEIRQHKAALTLLLRCRDAGVVARRDAFRAQFGATPAPRVPMFLFRPGVPYVPGVCFSCGDPLPALRFARCWRCSLAWRLAAGVRIASDFPLADALDSARCA